MTEFDKKCACCGVEEISGQAIEIILPDGTEGFIVLCYRCTLKHLTNITEVMDAVVQEHLNMDEQELLEDE